MGGGLVAEADGVDVVFVARDAEDGLAAFQVEDVDAAVAGACDDLAAVAREAEGPDAEVAAAIMAAAAATTAHVGEVELVGGGGFGVCVGEANCWADGAVGEEFVVWAEGGVCDGPLAVGVVDCLVVPPVEGVRGIIHSDAEVLGTGEEEVAIVGELSAVASLVDMYCAIGL